VRLAADDKEAERFRQLAAKLAGLVTPSGGGAGGARLGQLAAENERLRKRVGGREAKKAMATASSASPAGVDMKAVTERDVEVWLQANPGYLDRRARQLQQQQGPSAAAVSSPSAQSPAAGGPKGRPRQDAPLTPVSDALAKAGAAGASVSSALVDSLREREKRRTVLMSLAESVFMSLNTSTLVRTIMESARELVNAERCSVFLVDAATKELYTTISGGVEEVRIPITTGIAGHVATTQETLNIKDAYADKRFNPEVDAKTGFRTKSILCMPIKTYDGAVVGVAQLVNKKSGTFDSEDESLFLEFSVYCGIAIANARLYEASQAKEQELQEAIAVSESLSRKNELIISLAESINNELDVTSLARRIVDASRRLTNADRCALFKYDAAKKELSSLFMPGTDKPVKFSALTGVAGHAATHGVPLNVPDAYADPRFNKEVDKATGYTTKSILCMPVFDANRETVAVVQLINKLDDGDDEHPSVTTPGASTPTKSLFDASASPASGGAMQVSKSRKLVSASASGKRGMPQWSVFTNEDQDLFSSFATFAGIALRNAELYNMAVYAQKKTQVALELISYHSSCSREEVAKVFVGQPPFVSPELLEASRSYDFSIHLQDQDELCRLVYAWVDDLGLITRFNIPPERLCKLILSLRKNYRPVPYHNFIHAVCVGHSLYSYAIHTSLREVIDPLTLLGMFVACLCHDVDHRGTNNDFQISTNSPLAHIYGSSSVMENHHWDRSVTILSSPEHNIFVNLSPADFNRIFHVIRARIIDTDLSLHFAQRAKFTKLLEDNAFDRNNPDHLETLMSIVMTACDISTITKPFSDCEHWANIVCAEFFAQGDLEKALGKTPAAMLDRDKTKIPPMQVGFISFVGVPCYNMVARFFPGASHQVEVLNQNKDTWKAKADAIAAANQ
jgi:GAF domain-containing protein